MWSGEKKKKEEEDFQMAFHADRFSSFFPGETRDKIVEAKTAQSLS